MASRRTLRRRGLHTRRAYLLLETVLATGLLVTGLAVVGAKVQSSHRAIRQMDLDIRASLLLQQQLAELDMGLIELESIDEFEEDDFGPRHPDWGWRMRIENTALETMYRITVEVLYLRREDEYTQDSFLHDDAELLLTRYVFRPVPRTLDFQRDFGIDDEGLEELQQKLDDANINDLDLRDFDPSILANVDVDQLMRMLPVVMDVFGMDMDQLLGAIPPDLLEELRESGVIEDVQGAGGGGRGSGQGGGQGGGGGE